MEQTGAQSAYINPKLGKRRYESRVRLFDRTHTCSVDPESLKITMQLWRRAEDLGLVRDRGEFKVNV